MTFCGWQPCGPLLVDNARQFQVELRVNLLLFEQIELTPCRSIPIRPAQETVPSARSTEPHCPPLPQFPGSPSRSCTTSPDFRPVGEASPHNAHITLSSAIPLHTVSPIIIVPPCQPATSAAAPIQIQYTHRPEDHDPYEHREIIRRGLSKLVVVRIAQPLIGGVSRKSSY